MRRFISLGAGVQSSTMLLMACAGEFDDVPEAAIFADTGAEPASVYRWLRYLQGLDLPIPILTPSRGDLEAACVERRVSSKTGKRYVRCPLPLWLRRPNGSRGIVTRDCTRDYKVRVLRRAQREILGLHGRRSPEHVVAEVWLGISVDEADRMKPSGEAWVRNRWPLIEQGMTREACRRWMRDAGYPDPPRSACRFCPFHGADEWLRLQTDEPDEFARAAALERHIQAAFAEWDEVIDGIPFLWDGLRNLDEVDFAEEVKRPREVQLSLFGNECTGMCGV